MRPSPVIGPSHRDSGAAGGPRAHHWSSQSPLFRKESLESLGPWQVCRVALLSHSIHVNLRCHGSSTLRLTVWNGTKAFGHRWSLYWLFSYLLTVFHLLCKLYICTWASICKPQSCVNSSDVSWAQHLDSNFSIFTLTCKLKPDGKYKMWQQIHG